MGPRRLQLLKKKTHNSKNKKIISKAGSRLLIRYEQHCIMYIYASYCTLFSIRREVEKWTSNVFSYGITRLKTLQFTEDHCSWATATTWMDDHSIVLKWMLYNQECCKILGAEKLGIILGLKKMYSARGWPILPRGSESLPLSSHRPRRPRPRSSPSETPARNPRTCTHPRPVCRRWLLAAATCPSTIEEG